ncbi:hypothetical protein [Roseivivax sp.]
MTSNREAFCLICYLLGVAAPWVLLLVAAMLSLLTTSPAMGATAAYLAAAALGLLLMSYIVQRAAHMWKSAD